MESIPAFQCRSIETRIAGARMTIWLTDQHPEFTDWSPVCMSFHYNFLAKERVRDCWLQTYDVNNLLIGSELEEHLKLVDILAHLCYLI